MLMIVARVCDSVKDRLIDFSSFAIVAIAYNPVEGT